MHLSDIVWGLSLLPSQFYSPLYDWDLLTWKMDLEIGLVICGAVKNCQKLMCSSADFENFVPYANHCQMNELSPPENYQIHCFGTCFISVKKYLTS